MYVIETPNEILLQTFSKYEACGFWEALQDNGGLMLEATISFNGELLDTINPFDYSLDCEPDPLNFDDCEGLEFLL